MAKDENKKLEMTEVETVMLPFKMSQNEILLNKLLINIIQNNNDKKIKITS